MDVTLTELVLLVWAVIASALAHHKHTDASKMAWLIGEVLSNKDTRDRLVAAHAAIHAKEKV